MLTGQSSSSLTEEPAHFPTRTESTWDDWDTDGAEGSVNCLTRRPRREREADIGGTLAVRRNAAPEDCKQRASRVPDSAAYGDDHRVFSGNVSSHYPIRTSLTSSAVPTD